MPRTPSAPIRRPAIHEVFTDRIDERKRIGAFLDGLAATPMRRNKPILVFYGVGGMGKTSIKRETIRNWRENASLGAVELCFADCNIDADEFTPDYSIMSFFGTVLRPALRAAGFQLPLFESFYYTWFGKSNADIELSKSSLVSEALGTGGDSVDTLSSLVSGLESLGASFKGTALAIKAFSAFREMRSRRKLVHLFPELDLNAITLKQFHDYAGPVLAADLEAGFERKPNKALCIVIDGFERIQSRETRADVQNQFQVFCQSVLLTEPPVRCGVVLFGREKLRWRGLYDEPDNDDTHWDLYIDQFLLGGLSESDARAYLEQVSHWYLKPEHTPGEQQVGHLVDRHLESILEQAQEEPEADRAKYYHPYALELAVEQVVKHRDSFTPHVLGRGAKDLQARFLRDLDRRERVALHALAVSLAFDVDLFRTMVQSGVIVDYPIQGLHELSAPSYVIKNETLGTYRLHRKMQEALLIDLMQREGAAEQLTRIVEVVQAYYFGALDGLLRCDPHKAAQAYDRMVSILLEHARKDRLPFGVFKNFFHEINHFLGTRQGRYFHLAARIAATEEYVGILRRRNDEAESLDLAVALTRLGWLLTGQGEYPSSVPAYEEALALRTKALGEEHLDVALSLNNLAYSMARVGERDRAKELYERALSIREAEAGPSSPKTAWSLNSLARFVADDGDYERALVLFKRALAIREVVSGPNHLDTASTLYGLSEVYHSLSDPAEARRLCERALEIRVKELGEDHPYTAEAMELLASALCDDFEPHRARGLCERALIIREALGPDHPSVAENLRVLGKILVALGDTGAAREAYSRALAILRNRPCASRGEISAIVNALNQMDATPPLREDDCV